MKCTFQPTQECATHVKVLGMKRHYGRDGKNGEQVGSPFLKKEPPPQAFTGGQWEAKGSSVPKRHGGSGLNGFCLSADARATPRGIEAVKEMGSEHGWRSRTLYSPVLDAGLLTLLRTPGVVCQRDWKWDAWDIRETASRTSKLYWGSNASSSYRSGGEIKEHKAKSPELATSSWEVCVSCRPDGVYAIIAALHSINHHWGRKSFQANSQASSSPLVSTWVD